MFHVHKTVRGFDYFIEFNLIKVVFIQIDLIFHFSMIGLLKTTNQFLWIKIEIISMHKFF